MIDIESEQAQKRNNANVAHNWAHKTGHMTRGNNYFYTGDTIYSFGSHFECGKLVERNGVTVALITTNTWSGYTGRHINHAWSACNELLPIFRVPLYSSRNKGVQQTPKGWLASYNDRIEEAKASAKRARLPDNRAMHLTRVGELTEEANRFAEFFGLSDRLTVAAELAAEIAAAKEAAERFKAEAAEREAREMAEAEPKWRAHKRDTMPHAWKMSNAILRISIDGTRVETSKGADVPLSHAERAYKIALRYRARREAFVTNGHTIPVGHYKIETIDLNGLVKIGCHKIEWAEVERLASAAKWDMIPAEPEPAE